MHLYRVFFLYLAFAVCLSAWIPVGSADKEDAAPEEDAVADDEPEAEVETEAEAPEEKVILMDSHKFPFLFLHPLNNVLSLYNQFF
jgi:hypothetical protein